jgi:trehalose/maltose transport system substrate-binding protein
MKNVGLLGILLVSVSLGCSRQPSHEPVTLAFLDIEYDAPDRLPGLSDDLQAFVQETGIRVTRLPRPEESLNQFAMWRTLLQRGAPTPDVYGLDVIWSAIFNQYFLDLKPYFVAELSSQYPVVAASYTVGDKLVAVPHHAYVGVLMYRADLLRQYGYRAPPATWEELETIAARIQAGERAKGRKDFWGYAWQGAVSEDLTCAGLELQVSEGGGRIIEADQTISVNNPRTIRAWERAAHWIGTISPPSVVAYDKWDSDNAWKSGNAAFLRAWVSDYSLIANHTPPDNAAKFGVTSMPGGNAGRADTLGGNGLAVSRTSAHPQEAIQLIRFLLRRDALFMRASANSEPPKEQELRDLPEILNPYPQLAASRQRTGLVVTRPSIVSGSKYEDVSRAYIRALHSVLTGEAPPSAAAAALEKELMQITNFRVGLPSN